MGSTFLPPLHTVLVYVTLSGMALALDSRISVLLRSLHVLCLKAHAVTSHTDPGSGGARLLLQTCTLIASMMAQSLQ
jgi:hypothetical protein